MGKGKNKKKGGAPQEAVITGAAAKKLASQAGPGAAAVPASGSALSLDAGDLNDLNDALDGFEDEEKPLDQAAGPRAALEALLERQKALLASVAGLHARADRALAGHEAPAPGAGAGAEAAPAAAAVAAPKAARPTNDEEVVAQLMGKDTDVQRRMRKWCAEHGLAKSWFKRTPEDYYDWQLEQRRAFLCANTTFQLFKTMIMENTRASDADLEAGADKYVAVIVGYENRLHSDRLSRAYRGKPNNKVITKKRCNIRVIDDAISADLTGFGHNAVAPIGLATEMPIVLSDEVLKLAEDPANNNGFWLGGGEFDVKLWVDIDEFVRVTGAVVAPITYDRK